MDLMPKKFLFDVWLQGTKAQQKAEAERQDLARASFTRANLSEAERMVGRGKLLEATALENVELAIDDETRALAEAQLADALAMQGRFPEAATVHPDKERKTYFEKIVAALTVDDGDRCACPDTESKIGTQDIAVTPRFERDRVFSPIHNEVVSLVECSKCGDLNARPLVSRLLISKDAIAQNQAPGARRAISDAQVLAKLEKA